MPDLAFAIGDFRDLHQLVGGALLLLRERRLPQRQHLRRRARSRCGCGARWRALRVHARAVGRPPRGFAAARIEQRHRHADAEHAAASRGRIASSARFRPPNTVGAGRRARRAASASSVARWPTAASARSSARVAVARVNSVSSGDGRLARELDVGDNRCQLARTAWQHAREQSARASATADRPPPSAQLAGVAQFLLGAQAIEARALAFPLARAQDLDQPLDLLTRSQPDAVERAPAPRRAARRPRQHQSAAATAARRDRPPRRPLAATPARDERPAHAEQRQRLLAPAGTR